MSKQNAGSVQDVASQGERTWLSDLNAEFSLHSASYALWDATCSPDSNERVRQQNAENMLKTISKSYTPVPQILLFHRPHNGESNGYNQLT